MEGPSNTQVPSVEVGGETRYYDNNGGLHKEPSDAIRENQRTESDYSRGASGGCGQDADKVPSKS